MESPTIYVDYKQEVVPEIPDDISIPFPLPNGKCIRYFGSQVKSSSSQVESSNVKWG